VTRVRGISVPAAVKTTSSPTGMVIRTEAGVSVQGNGGATQQTVT
jgi:hypothetical protein